MTEEYLDDTAADTEVTEADSTQVLHDMKFFKSMATKSILF